MPQAKADLIHSFADFKKSCYKCYGGGWQSYQLFCGQYLTYFQLYQIFFKSDIFISKGGKNLKNCSLTRSKKVGNTVEMRRQIPE